MSRLGFSLRFGQLESQSRWPLASRGRSPSAIAAIPKLIRMLLEPRAEPILLPTISVLLMSCLVSASFHLLLPPITTRNHFPYDGTTSLTEGLLTFADEYSEDLSSIVRPRWIVTCWRDCHDAKNCPFDESELKYFRGPPAMINWGNAYTTG